MRPAQAHQTNTVPTSPPTTSPSDLGPVVSITSTNQLPFLHPRHITVKAGTPFRLTIKDSIYTISGHNAVSLPGPSVVPSRYFPRPRPGIRTFSTAHNLYSAPITDRIAAGTSQTFKIPSLPRGHYVIYCTLDAWTNLVAQ